MRISSLPAYQLRVIVEREELNERLTKLETFITNNTIFNKLNINEQERLIKQQSVMELYLKILDERIENF